MRLIISAEGAEIMVIGESFEIEGTTEKFAVHRSFGDAGLGSGEWTATHVQTGARVGFGDTLVEAIEHARSRWASKTSEEIDAALKAARLVRQAREALNRGVLQ